MLQLHLQLDQTHEIEKVFLRRSFLNDNADADADARAITYLTRNIVNMRFFAIA